MTDPGWLQPVCPRCKRRHLPTLKCWGGHLVKQLRAVVFERYGRVCWLCGADGADTVDHVRARAVGGTDAMDNLRPAHGFCNTGRGAGALSTPPGQVTWLDERSPRW